MGKYTLHTVSEGIPVPGHKILCHKYGIPDIIGETKKNDKGELAVLINNQLYRIQSFDTWEYID